MKGGKKIPAAEDELGEFLPPRKRNRAVQPKKREKKRKRLNTRRIDGRKTSAEAAES